MTFNGISLGSEFGRFATDGPPRTAFADHLRQRFDAATVKSVLNCLDQLRLPLPETIYEFVAAKEGALIPLDPFGVILRIEKRHLDELNYRADRIQDSQGVLRPIATIQAGNATVEICPGALFNDDPAYERELHKNLQREGISFHDRGLRNTALLPFRTPKFPKGYPIVIDRLAVHIVSESVYKIKKALETNLRRSADPQEELFGGLERVFAAAWQEQSKTSDAQKMEMFWQSCLQYTRDGILNAGWKNMPTRFKGDHQFEKTEEVQFAGKMYSFKIRDSFGLG